MGASTGGKNRCRFCQHAIAHRMPRPVQLCTCGKGSNAVEDFDESTDGDVSKERVQRHLAVAAVDHGWRVDEIAKYIAGLERDLEECRLRLAGALIASEGGDGQPFGAVDAIRTCPTITSVMQLRRERDAYVESAQALETIKADIEGAAQHAHDPSVQTKNRSQAEMAHVYSVVCDVLQRAANGRARPLPVQASTPLAPAGEWDWESRLFVVVTGTIDDLRGMEKRPEYAGTFTNHEQAQRTAERLKAFVMQYELVSVQVKHAR